MTTIYTIARDNGFVVQWETGNTYKIFIRNFKPFEYTDVYKILDKIYYDNVTTYRNESNQTTAITIQYHGMKP